MPWKETCVLDERMRFVVEYRQGQWSMADLCRVYGISRKTGYKLIYRYRDDGPVGLLDRSRAPRRQARAVSVEREEGIVRARTRHPTWGPRKLRAWLRDRQPREEWPAASTIGAILTRHGLTAPRRHRRHTPRYSEPFVGCTAPNDVWCADFKGWFRTGDGRRCDPFTLTDAASRFLLRCQVVPHPAYEWVQPIVEAAFREYGLPRTIRTDNGPPFASVGLGGLSRLAIEWIKWGIIPERIAPAHPEQNGRHERFHRTLAADTAAPPQTNARAQQRAFDRFRREYNEERPHEALGQKTPAAIHHPSPRLCPPRMPAIEYPAEMAVRRVGRRGSIRWRGDWVSLSRVLIGEWVGLSQRDDRYWDIYFGPVLLALWDAQQHRRVARAGFPSGIE